MNYKIYSKAMIIAFFISTIGITQSMTWYNRIKESTPLDTINIHANTIRSLEFSSDHRKLLTCSNDMTIKIYDLDQKTIIKTMKMQDVSMSKRLAQVWGGKGVSGYYKAIFGPNESTVISGSPDTDIILWDLSSQTEQRRLKGHEQPVSRLNLTKDGRFLISQSGSEVIVWDTKTWGELRRVKSGALSTKNFLIKATDLIIDIALTADQSKLYALTAKGLITGFSFPDCQQVVQFQHDSRSLGYSNYECLALSPDGRFLADGNVGGGIEVWNIEQKKVIKKFGHWDSPSGYQPSVYEICFIQNGSKLLTASADGTCRVWNMTSAKDEAETYFGLHQNKTTEQKGVFALGLSSDESLLATGGVDATIRIWKMPFSQVVSTTLKQPEVKPRSIPVAQPTPLVMAPGMAVIPPPPGGDTVLCQLEKPLTLDDLVRLADLEGGRQIALNLAKSRDTLFPIENAVIDQLSYKGYSSDEIKVLFKSAFNTILFRGPSTGGFASLNGSESVSLLKQQGIEWDGSASEENLRAIRLKDYTFGISTGNAVGDGFNTVMQAYQSSAPPTLHALWVRESRILIASKGKPFELDGRELSPAFKALSMGMIQGTQDSTSSKLGSFLSGVMPVYDRYITALNSVPAVTVSKDTPISIRYRSLEPLNGVVIVAYKLAPREDKVDAPLAFGWFAKTSKLEQRVQSPVGGYRGIEKIWGGVYMTTSDFSTLQEGDWLIATVRPGGLGNPNRGFILRVVGKPLEQSPYGGGLGW